MKENAKTIEVSSINVGDRIRIDYPKIKELAASIQKHGLLQPILVDSEMRLVAGGRRLEAIKYLGLPIIPTDWVKTRKDLTDIQLKEMELEENIQREDLSMDEELAAKLAIHRLKCEQHGDQSKTRNRGDWSLRKTAELLGESVGGLSQDIQLAEAIEQVPELKQCKTKAEVRQLLKNLGRKEGAKLRVQEAEHSDVFKHANNHYIIGDARKCLPLCNPGVVGFAEVDPPYGVNYDKRDGHDKSDYHEVDVGDYPRFLRRIATDLYSVLADQAWVVWWYASIHHHIVRTALEDAGFYVDGVPAIWFKGEKFGSTANAQYLLGRAYEPFFIARKGKPVLAKQGKVNVFWHAPLNPPRKYTPRRNLSPS